MPQLQPLTLNDSASTGHVFDPMSIRNDVASLKETTGVPIGDPTLTISVRPPVNGSEVHKIRLSLKVPVIDTVGSLTTVARTATAACDFLIPNTSTELEREDLLALFKSALASSDLATVITDLQPYY